MAEESKLQADLEMFGGTPKPPKGRQSQQQAQGSPTGGGGRELQGRSIHSMQDQLLHIWELA